MLIDVYLNGIVHYNELEHNSDFNIFYHSLMMNDDILDIYINNHKFVEVNGFEQTIVTLEVVTVNCVGDQVE